MKKAAALAMALLMAFTAGCNSKKNDQPDNDPSDTVSDTGNKPADPAADASTEPPTEHISSNRNVTADIGVEREVDVTIPKTTGSNTIKLPLSDFVQEGDVISSFTFTIYSSDGSDIGTFKGGCGISVTADCPSATTNTWYQSPDFEAPTTGSYGEITWNVPPEAASYIPADGDVLFGYWWGDCNSIRIASAACTFTRKTEISYDGTAFLNIGKSAGHDESVSVPIYDTLPENAVPEVVTFNITSSGALHKFVGGFGYNSKRGSYQSPNTVVFTDDSSAKLTWFVPEEAKILTAKDGEITLGHWWSEQPSVTLDSVSIEYSLSGSIYGSSLGPAAAAEETDFRSSEEIVKDIKVGWNLGNTLDSYNTIKTGTDSEIGWGNPRTTEDMILSVKNAGFNAVRIPVTWGEHMDGDKIQISWMNRVQEVVDYTYNNDMYVILNIHHDDYLWLDPTDDEYAEDSAKLKKIWEQISDRFKDYGDRLIFEGMNEVRTIGSANEWIGGTPDERKIVNQYVRDFVDTVRASGGNNAARSLIVSTYGANAEEVSMNALAIPDDSHIIVSLHYYAPWMFSSGQSVIFGDAEKAELQAKFDVMKGKFIDRGYPLIIGEFGCVDGADNTVRAGYYETYISEAKARGIKCFVWDNGIMSGEESYGIFDRKNKTWNETILGGIMDGAK